ncbi:MAG TPA: phosphoribosylformylglycinamidine synthase subunit PurL [Gordonia sp. (in: high G+C Gram-positive bacteria)]|uniref:phosphoribosylformylglycinamidine synthase subunit PurL n=1 Tax=unclassified Gordonia (in: high G+C Gram-positive bacteria) TaxID=2657482 RepID=UPI000F966A57|nr:MULTISPECIES: phosphoribosylformylglycinamidine synthase subunit PurL [unclassified Gordonia (in: high G+C Gram-positive bacteria)]RUP41725.1 MAG: phosphoribosylformylglycinamidine synthase subunit PurL [Gordonia sp. (in: high G+C Gram-positive bacteria)]HNP57865.1 phosphoribosylformylglycinamidine synthase subunit PurL [Gordonia sp. (in: high G+C Gram-positive bacteria)]HRC51419.1 phosphoribosylformylglycinamidine synthase subunit PurL [Gordonia sp. (in: high G+C Gram-positive bacteria)]
MTSHVDTVSNAEQTPDHPQPFTELGLKDDEYARIREILGRRPTDAELAMYSVMWSEHCSYKSSKVHLRYFGETTTEEMRSKMLAGIGENAGVVDIGDGWAVTFKVESHNHPSYVEPYQGAATGVGGIVRDIMAMGARPIAVMDQLRFGAADAPDTRRVVDGVVRGVGGYGNSLGLPNIGGETVFDASYAGNPLVNALCAGVLRTEDLKLAFASGAGNQIILFGARTGLDGIGGVSVLASETFDDDGGDGPSRKKLPSVQVGDPFTEKVLIECCLDLYREDLVVGIQDLGGAGLSCATSELAAAGDGGMHIDLEKVPMRAQGMTPAEVLSSESQERMCAVVAPENVEKFMAVCRRWDVLATVIGEVTDGEHLVIDWHGQTVVDVPPRTVAHQGPVYERPLERPEWQDDVIADTSASLNRPSTPDELRATTLAMISSPALCSRAFITEQYDRYVRGNTVLAEHADSGMIRIDEETGRGIALATDASGRYTFLDPYRGAQLALAEAYRNVSVSGAAPVAVTNCLNFGSPENPAVMWQFSQAVRGLADGCAQLGIPVTGGNVSFYNQTGSTPILPTPVVGVLGVIDDVKRRIPTGFGTEPGETLILLGETRDEFDGSIWAQVTGDHLGGVPPVVDLEAERLLGQILVAASRDGLVSAAHDLSEGGLIQAVVESALAGETGCRIILPDGADPFVWLFSESAGRVLVSVPRTEESRFCSMLDARSQPWTRIGVVDQGADDVSVQDQFSIPLSELRQVHGATLPALFGEGLHSV